MLDITSIGFDKTAVERSICKKSFFQFFKMFWKTISGEPLVLNWHIRYLCDEMQTMAERVFNRQEKLFDYCINISPSSSKSSLISVLLPAWIWTNMPSCQIITCSYAFPLASDLSQKSRDVISSELYRKLFPEIQLRGDKNMKHHYQNTLGGWRYACGIDGIATGFHAHIIIIDDPLDPTRAMSEIELRAANTFVNDTLDSRKVQAANCPMILVMQRLSIEDTTEVFLKRKKLNHICIPAEMSDDIRPKELEQFYVNGLMDPIRLSRGVLAEKKAKGDHYYGTQFMQSPLPVGGGLFKTERIKRAHTPKHFQSMVRAWDKAASISQRAAYTCGTLLGLDYEDRVWVLDVVRGRWDSFDREQKILQVAKKDGKNVRVVLEQEMGSGGAESANNTMKRLMGHKVTIIKVTAAGGGKEDRAEPLSVQMNASNLWVPLEIDWWDEWINEFKHFPNSKYKDQVDSAAHAFNELTKKKKRIGGLVNRWS